MVGTEHGSPPDETAADREQRLVEFAAAASHDLSTPLQLIAGYADLLADRLDRGDADAQAAMDGIQRAVDRMRALVDGLLGYARLGDELAAERVDSEQVVRETVHALQGEIQATGASVEIGDGLPEVFVIPGQLHQLFQNLLSNALKFRADRPPRIVVACESEPGVWHFTIADNGIGIESREVIGVFDLFRRSRRVPDRPGSGIGLAVAKGVVERHGGRIWVESDPGEGSTFHFTLPRELRRAGDPDVAA
jgi:signal transduction histidine kinase